MPNHKPRMPIGLTSSNQQWHTSDFKLQSMIDMIFKAEARGRGLPSSDRQDLDDGPSAILGKLVGTAGNLLITRASVIQLTAVFIVICWLYWFVPPAQMTVF